MNAVKHPLWRRLLSSRTAPGRRSQGPCKPCQCRTNRSAVKSQSEATATPADQGPFRLAGMSKDASKSASCLIPKPIRSPRHAISALFSRWTPNLEPGRLGWGKLPKPKRAAYNWKKRSSLVSRLVGPLKLTSRARTWIHGSGARTSPTGRRRKRPSSLVGLPRPPALGRMAKMCTHHGRHAVTKSCCC